MLFSGSKTSSGFNIIKECLFIVSILFSVVLFFALFSYNPADNNWKGDPNAINHVTNAIGVFGAVMSDGLFSYLGICAYLLPIMFAYLAYVAFFKAVQLKQIDFVSIGCKIIGFDCLLISCCTLVSKMQNFGPYSFQGGHLGSLVYDWTSGWFGYEGTIFAMLFLLIIGVPLFTGLSWFVICSFIGGVTLAIFDINSRFYKIIKKLIGRNTAPTTNNTDEDAEPVVSIVETQKTSTKSASNLKISISDDDNHREEAPKKVEDKSQTFVDFTKPYANRNDSVDSSDLTIPGLSSVNPEDMIVDQKTQEVQKVDERVEPTINFDEVDKILSSEQQQKQNLSSEHTDKLISSTNTSVEQSPFSAPTPQSTQPVQTSQPIQSTPLSQPSQAVATGVTNSDKENDPRMQPPKEYKYASSVVLPPPTRAADMGIEVSVKPNTEESKFVLSSNEPLINNTTNSSSITSANTPINDAVANTMPSPMSSNEERIEPTFNGISSSYNNVDTSSSAQNDSMSSDYREPSISVTNNGNSYANSSDFASIPLSNVSSSNDNDDNNVISLDTYKITDQDIGSIPNSFIKVDDNANNEPEEEKTSLLTNEPEPFGELPDFALNPRLDVSAPKPAANNHPEAKFVKHDDLPDGMSLRGGHMEFNDNLSEFPSVEIFQAPKAHQPSISPQEINALIERLDACLKLFKIKARVAEKQIVDQYGQPKVVKFYESGPIITRFYLELLGDQRATKIEDISSDIARNLMIGNIRVIQTVPGTSYVAIEIPNTIKQNINMRELLESDEFKNSKAPLTICLGRDIIGKPVIYDLAKAPHLLVAGTTGSGKSVGINTMLVSLLMKNKPEDMKLIMIDPKVIEFTTYKDIPHLITPVISDMKNVASALRWACVEMDRRYVLMSKLQVRNIDGYNAQVTNNPNIIDPTWHPNDNMDMEAPKLGKLPYIVIVVDEFADLMLQLKKQGDIEGMISRLAAKARAAGMHLILATQSPRKDVITGTIRSNFPSQIAFKVKSNIDSRIILDSPGAEHLLGRGDMLIKFNDGNNDLRRAHGAYISDDEVNNFADAWRARGKPVYNDDVANTELTPSTAIPGESAPVTGDTDALFDQIVEFCRELKQKNGKFSVSLLQRRFSIGYSRAARVTETLADQGIVSAPLNGSGVREVLID